MILWTEFDTKDIDKIIKRIGMSNDRQTHNFLINCSFKHSLKEKWYIAQAYIVIDPELMSNDIPTSYYTIMIYGFQGNMEISHYSRINKPKIK